MTAVAKPGARIESLHALEILDSRGNPTLRVRAIADDGSVGVASVPSGASTGTHEALELRDGDPKRYLGKGVLKAIEHVHATIAPAMRGMLVADQSAIDRAMIELDGTPNKSRLGANAILGVSLACAHAAAASAGISLHRQLGSGTMMPVPMMNVINGGKHAEGALQFQECMIVPLGAPTLRDAVRWGSEVFHVLGRLLHDSKLPTTVGDEGGYAPPLAHIDDALTLLVDAIKKAGYEPGRDIALALDSAASEFKQEGGYLAEIGAKPLSSSEMIALYERLMNDFPLVSIEDGLAEEDWDGWEAMTARLGSRVQLVGDDLFVTNVEFLQRGIDAHAANAILIKVNQIGTLTETIACVRMAQHAGYGAVISHRSGETADTTIADLAVALDAGQIKTGSLSRSDRVEKYNRLIAIEEELGSTAHYAGRSAFATHALSSK